MPIRSPEHIRKLIPDLHHGWPNVIKKLNFNYWFQPPQCKPNGSTYDARLSIRRTPHPVATVGPLEPGSRLEDSSLAFKVHQEIILT